MSNTYPERLIEEVKLEIIGKYKTSNDKHKLKCLLCGDMFHATPKSKIANYKKSKLQGCPTCTLKARHNIVRTNNISKLQNTFEILTDLDETLFSNTTMLKVKNKACGHTFTSKTGNLLNRNVQCPVCNVEKKRLMMLHNSEIQRQTSFIGKEGFDLYKSEVRALTNRTYTKHKKLINPDHLLRGRSGTEGAHHLDHVISIKYCFDHGVPVDICSHKDNLRIVPWKINAVKWKRPSFKFPKIFWGFIDKYQEKLHFLGSITKHIPSLKPPKHDNEYELDLYSSESETGVICHRFDDASEKTVGSKHHLSSITMYYQEKGIHVMHIFEDEWLGAPELVINKLKHITGNSDATKIYARNCTIKSVSGKEKTKILRDNHIQGNDTSQMNIGAYYGSTLVAVMTFCKPRVFMRRKNTTEYTWELSRFVTDFNFTIVGIASKLLKHFQRNNKWDEIYSFADLRWSSSAKNVYKTLGFTESPSPSIGYYYIVDGVREHRWKYQKNNIKKLYPTQYDANLTEYQNMLKLGYDRVWNCGILKYTIQNK